MKSALRGRLCHKMGVFANPQKSANVIFGPFRLVASLWQNIFYLHPVHSHMRTSFSPCL